MFLNCGAPQPSSMPNGYFIGTLPQKDLQEDATAREGCGWSNTAAATARTNRVSLETNKSCIFLSWFLPILVLVMERQTTFAKRRRRQTYPHTIKLKHDYFTKLKINIIHDIHLHELDEMGLLWEFTSGIFSISQ